MTATLPTVQMIMPVPQSRIQDLLEIFFNDARPRWLYEVVKYEYADGVTARDFAEDGQLQDPQCYRHPNEVVPFVHGCSVTLLVEDPDNRGSAKQVQIDLRNIRRAMELMVFDNYDRFMEILNEEEGCHHALMFGQYMIYGKIVYA